MAKKHVITVDGEERIVTPRQFLVVSALTYVPEVIENFEMVDPVSQTVPDMELTIQQLFEKYASGGTVIGFEPQYYDDLLPDLANWDLSQKQEALEALADQRKILEEAIAKDQQRLDEEAQLEVKKQREMREFFEAHQKGADPGDPKQ